MVDELIVCEAYQAPPAAIVPRNSTASPRLCQLASGPRTLETRRPGFDDEGCPSACLALF
jgi:hypothetical protein